MSGGGSKQIVGYRYFLALHMGLCRGPINEIVETRIGDRTAYSATGEGVTGGGSGLPVYYGGGTGSGGAGSGGDVDPYDPPFDPDENPGGDLYYPIA